MLESNSSLGLVSPFVTFFFLMKVTSIAKLFPFGFPTFPKESTTLSPFLRTITSSPLKLI